MKGDNRNISQITEIVLLKEVLFKEVLIVVNVSPSSGYQLIMRK
jgi:hypothetical protein